MNNHDDTVSGTEQRYEASTGGLLAMSVISAMVYAAIAWLLFRYAHGRSFMEVFYRGLAADYQLAVGVGAGVLAAIVIIGIIRWRPVREVLDDFYLVKVIRQMRFSSFDRIQVSLFAGAGEELLFRGAIQPLLGIWVTSAIFIGIHGYIRFRKPGHIIFTATMFGLSMLLGLLFEYCGLVSAMAAHAAYDVIMLWKVQEGEKSNVDRKKFSL